MAIDPPQRWPRAILVIALLFGSFAPLLLFDFGYHNDFEIWAYDNKVCCSGFPETIHLIRIGRFLQAYLQNVYLMAFTDLHSLVYGRALGIAVSAIGALMLMAVTRRNGMDRLSSTAFGICAFLLPPAQVNMAWITNFIPGILNAIIVLAATLILPEWEAVAARERRAFLMLGTAFLLLLASLFNYPPTAGFFLIAPMVRLLYSPAPHKRNWASAIYAGATFAIACGLYFALHRAYMRMFGITFPAGALYQFEISTQLWGNFTRFGRELVPVFFNLWNPAPVVGVAGAVAVIIALAAGVTLRRSAQPSGRTATIITACVLLGLFLSMNVSGIAGSGRPPLFYRAWHPAAAGVMLLVFSAAAVFVPASARKFVYGAFVAAGCLFSFNSSWHLATVLSRQFTFAEAQFKAQFSPERQQYIIIEQRPIVTLFGHPRWGELGFIHILSPGHGSYILKKDFNDAVHPMVEPVAVMQRDNRVLLEPELLDEARWLLYRSPTDVRNALFDDAFDFREDTLFASSVPAAVDVVGEARVTCYGLDAGIDPSPSRMPRAWRLRASNDDKTWVTLDEQTDQVEWRQTEKRLFMVPHPGRYKRFRLDVDSSNDPGTVEIPELLLFVRPAACRDPIASPNIAPDRMLVQSFNSMAGGAPVALAGTVMESGLSDPPFRLQRAFDNIYYTFWETYPTFPVNVDLRFFSETAVRCYAFSAGDDQANDRMPTAWQLLTSDDGHSWTAVDMRKDESGWTDSSRRTFQVASPMPHRFYRIAFLGVNGGNRLRLYEISLSDDRGCQHTIP